MIERAGVHPHAGGPELPCVTHGPRQQMLADAVPDRAGRETEICDLDRIVLRYAPELVPPNEVVATG